MKSTLPSSRDELRTAHDKYNADPGFGLPGWAKERPAKVGQQVVFLGRTSFTSCFLDASCSIEGLGIVDDFKVGEIFHGLRCISSVDLLKLTQRCPDLICIDMSRWDFSHRYFRSLARDFNLRLLTFEQAIRYFNPPDIDHRSQDWGPYIRDNLEAFLEIGERFSDDYSRETLNRVLLFHLTTDHEHYLHITRPYETLYFRSGFFRLGSNERFIDGGASIGESMTQFLGITGEEFDCISLIEPDRLNVPKLQRIKDQYLGTSLYDRIELFPYALGAKSGNVAFSHEGGHTGCILEGEGDVEVRAMDEFIKFDPTFLKLDIEGYELPALQGGAQMIAGSRPKIAISAYHRPNDIVEITRLIMSLNPDYHIGLRHHNMARYDTCLYFF